MKLEESSSLTSDYTTKLQSSKQYHTGTNTEAHTSMKQIGSPETYRLININSSMTKEEKSTGKRKDSLFSKWSWVNTEKTEKNETRILPNTIHKNKLKMD